VALFRRFAILAPSIVNEPVGNQENPMEKKLIIASAVKEELKARSGLATISSEAIDWVNSQVEPLLDLCANTGRRTPGGRLMAPPPVAAATEAAPVSAAPSP
jgi:hypothetical protein